MRRRLIRVASAALVLGAAACGRDETEERGAAIAVEDVPAARVAALDAGGFYRAAGSVRASRRAELSTRLAGRVETVRVRAGDRVRSGQLLLTVERASLAAAQRQADAALELATSSLRRVERLYADSAAPLVQLEAARNALAQAEGQARAVRADLAYAELRAPFDGRVASRLVDPGDLAGPGQPLLVVEDATRREIVVSVPDELRGRVRPGERISVELGDGRRRIEARVLAEVTGADPRSPTVELRLAGPIDLTTGLAAVAEIPTGERAALLLPASALVERGQLQGVFLFAPDSTLRLRWIRAGRVRGDSVEVVSGLEAGDLVALRAADARDGLPARPQLAGGAD
jgi:RND family efflux transporter MFP subunit